MKRKLRVLVLMHEDLVPPETVESAAAARAAPYKTEYDVLRALRKLGHEARPLGVHDDLSTLRDALTEFRPHLTFNVLEEFHGVTMYGQAVISYLELLRAAYSGCNPRGLMLAHDKLLTKKLLAYHRLPVPRATVFPLGRAVRASKRLVYPLIVKSTFEDASLGISQASIVHSEEKLVERVHFMHERFGTDALAEEFVEGRELYVGLLGNQRVRVLPVWEMKFNKWPDGQPRIATEKVKWDLKYQAEHDIQTARAEDLPAGVARRIERVARAVWRVLGLSGYARMDLRLTEDGRVYVIEANANPDLARDEDFAQSALAVGLDYPALIQRILQLGLSWRPKWKEAEQA
jgi:D-alanine-D-alanine ligase